MYALIYIYCFIIVFSHDRTIRYFLFFGDNGDWRSSSLLSAIMRENGGQKRVKDSILDGPGTPGSLRDLRPVVWLILLPIIFFLFVNESC